MEIENLVIEVTRQCNLSCEHCLRGNSENLDMPLEYVETLFSKVGCISNLTISGGEPSLRGKQISQIIELAKKYDVDIGNFYIATNAVVCPDDFLLAIIQLYVYCSDNEISAVNWSNDMFHENKQNAISRLEVFSFAEPKYSDKFPMTYDNLIAEGKAEYLGGREMTAESFEIGEDQIREGTLYLNCKGNLIAGCDFSYDNQDEPENIICHISELNLDKFIAFIDD